MVMEQPEVFTLTASGPGPCSLYTDRPGPDNKTIVRAADGPGNAEDGAGVHAAGFIRRRYELAEINYAMEHIHFSWLTRDRASVCQETSGI